MSRTVKGLLENLSELLVLREAADESMPGEVSRQLEEISTALVQEGQDESAEITSAATKLIADSEDPAAAEANFALVEQTVAALQAVIFDARDFMEAGFPEELCAARVTNPGTAQSDSDSTAQDDLEMKPADAAPACSFDDGDIIEEFLSRQVEVLGEMEKTIVSLEEEGDQLPDLMRFLHTLKGESALLGLGEVADMCHRSEDMLQREEPQLCVDRLLAVKDWLVQSLVPQETNEAEPMSTAELIASLDNTLEEAPAVESPQDEDESSAASPAVAPTVAAEPEGESVCLFDLDVELLQDFVEEAREHVEASAGHLLILEADSTASEPLNAVFRAFHTIKGLAGFLNLELIKELSHKAENLLDLCRKGEAQLVGTNLDLVFEAVDLLERNMESIATALEGDGIIYKEAGHDELLARILTAIPGAVAPAAGNVPAPVATPEPVADIVADTPRVAKQPAVAAKGFIPLKPLPKSAKPEKPVEDPKEDPKKDPKKKDSPQGHIKMREAVRVDADRLDCLVDTIGEMVIAESMVSQMVRGGKSDAVHVARQVDHLDKISRELQEIGMSLRMVPVKPAFQKMARLVRDLAKKSGRQIKFSMLGEETELDKNVVDKIGDPLVHILRNAVDHGIESDASERSRAGKPEMGTVSLRAFHKGGNICIEIADDGKGLDKDRIYAKGVERGLVKEGDALSDREIFNLIFEPGFSTAKKVTEISGRGVGMDVVRRNIEELRGRVDITSEPGRGSTFTFTLPLTMAIIEGMVLSVDAERYIIPTLSIVRLVSPTSGDITTVLEKGEILEFENKQIPLFRLHEMFETGTARDSACGSVVVVVEDEKHKIGLMVDKLLGQQQIVIKGLGESLQGTAGLAGGAILSDGQVALILDVGGLTEIAMTSGTNVTVSSLAANDARKACAARIDDMSPSRRQVANPDAESGAADEAEVVHAGTTAIK